MRSLGKPEVLMAAMLAGLGTALLCYPRVATQAHPHYPVWYTEAVAFLGSIVLWGFVFAWHTQYTQRPVFMFKVELGPWALATAVGLGAAAFWHLVLDPRLRPILPEEYPTTTQQWLARALFSLGLSQLFLVFAPFAWLVRLFGKPRAAFVLTVVFGVAVMVVRNAKAPTPLPAGPLLAAWLLGQVAGQVASVYFFLRGGVLLVWWSTLVFQSHLLW